MDKKQYKILKKISKTNVYNYTNSSAEEISIIHYLAKNVFIIYYPSDEKNIKLCQINQNGKSALYEWKISKRRWKITTIIAIFAAIGAYRSELSSIAQAIEKLWILLTEH